MGCCCSSSSAEADTKSRVFFMDSGGERTNMEDLKDFDKKPIMLVPGVGGTRLIATIYKGQTPNRKHSKQIRDILAWPNIVRPSGALENFLIGHYNPETRTYVSMSEAISPVPGVFPGHSVAKIAPVEGSTGLEGCDSLVGSSYPDFIREYAGYFIKLQDHFEREWKYRKGVDLFAFGFDWRLAPTCGGFLRKMHKSVKKAYCAANGISLADEEKEKDKKGFHPERKKITIIGHSYGGVITKNYLITHSKQYLRKNLPEGAKITTSMTWYKYVNKFVAIGTPFDGAGGILTACPFSGYTFGMSPMLFNSVTSSTIERTCPAFPFLLPNTFFRYGAQPDVYVKIMKRSTGKHRVSTSFIRMSENVDAYEEVDSANEDNPYASNRNMYFSCDEEDTYISTGALNTDKSRDGGGRRDRATSEEDAQPRDREPDKSEPTAQPSGEPSAGAEPTPSSNAKENQEEAKDSNTAQDSETGVELPEEKSAKKEVKGETKGETELVVVERERVRSESSIVEFFVTSKNKERRPRGGAGPKGDPTDLAFLSPQLSTSSLSPKMKSYGVSADTVPMLGKILFSFGLYCQGREACLDGGLLRPPSEEMMEDLRLYLPKLKSIKAKIPFITKNLLLSHFGKRWRKQCFTKNKVTEYEGDGRWVRFSILPGYLSTVSRVAGKSDFKRAVRAVVQGDADATAKGLRRDSKTDNLAERFRVADVPQGLMKQIEANKSQMDDDLAEMLNNLNNYQAGLSTSPISSSPGRRKRGTPIIDVQEVTAADLQTLETRSLFDLYSRVVPPCPVLQYVCNDEHSIDAFEHSCELLPIDPKIVFDKVPGDDFKYVSIVGNSLPTKYHTVAMTPVEDLAEIFDSPVSFVMCEGDGTVPILSSLADGFPEKWVSGRFVVTNCGHFDLMMNPYTYRIIERLLGLRSF